MKTKLEELSELRAIVMAGAAVLLPFAVPVIVLFILYLTRL